MKVEFEVLQPTQVVQVVRKGFVSRQWNVSYFQLVPLQPRLKLLDLNLTLLLEHPRGEGGGGVRTIMAYAGRLRPERDIVYEFRLQV